MKKCNKKWVLNQNNLNSYYLLRTKRLIRQNSLKTKGMSQNPLFKGISVKNSMFWLEVLWNVIFYSFYKKTNINYCRECPIKNFYCYFCIFYCVLLAVSWFSFVLSFRYNFRKTDQLKLKFGQRLQVWNIFRGVE